jgi:hypothetical protein
MREENEEEEVDNLDLKRGGLGLERKFDPST